MTVLIEMPGVLTSTAGFERVVTTLRGFPDTGLKDLVLFEDGIGNAVANSVSGRASGLIEVINPGDFGDSYAWQGSGGGLEIQGAQIVSMPEFDPTGPWTMVYMGAVTGSISGAAEAITALLAFRDRSNVDVRGPALFARAFGAGGFSGKYQVRANQGSVDGAAVDMVPLSVGVVSQRRVALLSYNGSSQVTASMYDKAGVLISTATVSASDLGMTTSSGVSKPLVQPSIGTSNQVYDGGKQLLEGYGLYTRVLPAMDIVRICGTAAALGTARGRPW